MQPWDTPGRRFAPNSSKGDQLLGLFGFVSLFFAIASFLFMNYNYSSSFINIFFCINLVAAILCLIVRGLQVGASTTKESIQAIKDAWSD